MALAMSTITMASVMQEPMTMSAIAHCGRLSESANGPTCRAGRGTMTAGPCGQEEILKVGRESAWQQLAATDTKGLKLMPATNVVPALRLD
jgi:hypothetical protein